MSHKNNNKYQASRYQNKVEFQSFCSIHPPAEDYDRPGAVFFHSLLIIPSIITPVIQAR